MLLDILGPMRIQARIQSKAAFSDIIPAVIVQEYTLTSAPYPSLFLEHSMIFDFRHWHLRAPVEQQPVSPWTKATRGIVPVCLFDCCVNGLLLLTVLPLVVCIA